jgi:hypothetical protein
MTNWTDFTGLASAELFIALSVSLIVVKLAVPVRRLIVVIAVVLSFLPLESISLAAYLRGVTGDFSVTTILLMVLTLSDRLAIYTYKYQENEKIRSFATWATMALWLYPCALGISRVDPYRWGFGSTYFLISLVGLVLLAYYARLRLVAWSAVIATGAWTIGWYESNNLWDYLIDPWLSTFVILSLLYRTFCFSGFGRMLRGSQVLEESQPHR